MAQKLIVIYTRFSTEMQRNESCKDQERDVRTELTRRGLDLSDVVVIRDEAESGTKANRQGYQQLQTLMNSGQIAVLAVDDQSRLTRGDDAMRFICDLVYSGGRFISTTENIDTQESGWELKVKVMELQNGVAIRGLSDKVRRGQRGRVLADDSAGDFPYGHESFYHDPNWQQLLANRGPKPKKGIRINKEEASWVRKIFQWFLEGKSIQGIACELTEQGVLKGHRSSKPGWHPQQVHRILNNTKYTGRWTWGKTKIIRNSIGRKKQIATAVGDSVFRDRPELVIISQETWDQAQTRLSQLRNKFGMKPNQAKRGPKAPTNTSDSYPRSILGAVLRCAACGSRMWYCASNQRRYYKCSGFTRTRCKQSFQVRAVEAEQTVINQLITMLSGWPDWLDYLHQKVQELLKIVADQIPFERVCLEGELETAYGKRANVIEAIENGGSIPILVETLKKLESTILELESRLTLVRMPSVKELELPSREWVQHQLAEWTKRLSDPQRVAIAIRDAVESIEARSILSPGKKRGYVELTLRYRHWDLFRLAVGTAWPISIRNALPDSLECLQSGVEVITLGEPTLMDRWASQIVQWREQGIIWKEIVERTGMDLNRVYVAYKRYRDAQQSHQSEE